jgi:hypothetical protein
MRRNVFVIALGAAAVLAACSPEQDTVIAPTIASLKNSGPTVTYTGQGLVADGFGGFDLQTEICGIANGAEVDGPYLLWNFTATGAPSATITGPWGTANMVKFGNGTFKYVSGWYPPASLTPNVVSASYTGTAHNPQLVISHGCRPFTTPFAWCSPGFWRNATDAAWAQLEGGATKASTFGTTVAASSAFAAINSSAVSALSVTTLNTILTTSGGTYKGANIGTFKGFSANAFNLVGAYLSDLIPGYDFDSSVVSSDDSQSCPIDHFGNFKVPQP